MYDVQHGIAMEPMKAKWASSRVDFRYTELFCIPEVHQCSSRFVTVFLGTLCCSIKKIEAPYIFDWENGIALHAIQGNRASFPSEGDVSYDFSSCSKHLGIYTSYSGDGHSKLHFVQRSQDTCAVMWDTAGI